MLLPVPFVPEVRMHSAEAVIPLWETMESAAGEPGLSPPFWAFPWAGGQALARHILDHPGLVAGRRVLDLASGGGLVAIAAALAGASDVVANDIDPYAAAAVTRNAQANGVRVTCCLGDLLAEDAFEMSSVDVVLAGDVFYSRDMAAAMLVFLRRAAASGVDVLVGDPGRAYAPQAEVVAVYEVTVLPDLESAGMKRVAVLRI